MQTQLLFDAQATLGESPIWDARTQTLYWIDILQRRVFAGAHLVAQLDDLIGCLARRANGHLVLALTSDEGSFSFMDLDPGSGQRAVFAALDMEPPTNRFNDGKCDPAGRFLVGTMDRDEKQPRGSLYAFDGSQSTRLIDGITIANGLAWSPDHKTFYYIDTATRIVRAFDYDVSSGALANSRPAIRIPKGLGWPDGMTSDTKGNLWIAMWGGAQITKWDPLRGELLERITVPALNSSSCVFGGNSMNELYVTSARHGLSAAELKKYPLSGGLFKIDTRVEGMQTFEFAF